MHMDPSFGDQGRVILPAPTADARLIAYDTAAVENAAIVVALSYQKTIVERSQFGIARLLNNGNLDKSFGSDGFAIHPGPDPSRNTVCVKPYPLPDGKTLLHCTTGGIGEPHRPLLARLDIDGSLDTTFGTNGFKTFPEEDHGLIDASFTRAADGRILVIGRREVAANGKVDGLIMRLREDGSPDTSFGQEGVLIVDFEGGRGNNVRFGIQVEERFVLAGSNASHALVRRFLSTGERDTTFGVDGLYTVPGKANPHGGTAWFNDFLRRDDGRFVGIGSELAPEGEGPYYEGGFIAALGVDGMPDPAFAEGQVVFTPAEFGLTTLDRGVIDPLGRIVVIGSRDGSNTRLIVGRYTASGLPDASFGDLGYGIIDFGGESASLRGASVQGSQGILVSAQSPMLGKVRANLFRIQHA